MEPQLLLPRPSLHDNDQEDSCEICYDDYPTLWKILPCTHKLCNQCYTKLQANSCPWCRFPLGNSRLGPEEVLPTNSNVLSILDIDQPELSRRRTRRRRNRINYSLEDEDFDIRRLRSESDPGPQYTVRHELNTPEEVINYEREAVRRIDSRRRAARREKINAERDHPGNRKHQHGRRDILSRLRSPIALARNAATRNTRGL